MSVRKVQPMSVEAAVVVMGLGLSVSLLCLLLQQLSLIVVLQLGAAGRLFLVEAGLGPYG